MSSKREEERNEKIIRGLMKLPPNRRCINCNSSGPQYVCADFWTFVCTTCSGIHREFTHRVKSVSMAKFTSQEVDALQKGGNQRARELFLSAWDLEKNRLPNNSNIDKVRQFIKNVYVDKIYTMGKSSNRPPRDPQSLGSDEDQTRRASSYHSYSQSPPYDFQYEERRYGKCAPTLTRPGSDRGLYEANLASFLSPTHLSARANDDGFSNEVSFPRVSDYTVSGGSPFRETSRDISNEAPQQPTVVHDSDAISRSNAGTTLHPQRMSSLGSFGSFDSSSVAHSVNLAQKPISAATTSTSVKQQIPEKQQPPLNLLPMLPQQQLPSSTIGEDSDLVVPSTGGWATFDMPQNMVPMGTESNTFSVFSSSDGDVAGNPFSIDQSASYPDFTGYVPSAATNTFVHQIQQSVEATSNIHLWNAFEDSSGGQPNEEVLHSGGLTAIHGVHDDTSVSKSDSYVQSAEMSEPPSGLSSSFILDTNDFPMILSSAGIYSTNGHRATNPFDLPYDADVESSSMLWGMSSLQSALPNAQTPTSYIGGVDHSWFPQSSIPAYAPESLGFVAGQAPSNQILIKINVHAQGHVASVGGNPFA